MTGPNVLRVNATEERDAYREAVASILRAVQTEHDVTLLEISERIDVSLGTISNAANKKTDLCPAYLKRLGKVFGGHALDPFHKLYGGRFAPLETDESDAMPKLTAAIHKLALARSPGSPGGERITHCELLDMEGDIDAAIRALTALKMGCDKARAA